jgi:hypothetical protein
VELLVGLKTEFKSEVKAKKTSNGLFWCQKGLVLGQTIG